MIRLFVGLDLPGAAKERLAGIGAGVPGARWVAPENLHLNLRFIGEVEEGLLPEIDDALAGIVAPAFELTLAGVDFFGNRKSPRVLCVKVERNDRLLFLHDKVETAIQRAGLGPEDRKFIPHVTLARLRDTPFSRLGRYLEQNGAFRAGPYAVDRFTLFSSVLTKGGPVYQAERTYPLVPA